MSKQRRGEGEGEGEVRGREVMQVGPHRDGIRVWLAFQQGTLTEGEGSLQLTSSLKVACFVKK